MVVGFNHNFSYRGEIYHVQTEDGGLKSPNIITLLYKGGNILASRKTSYADICKVDNLEQVVEELMKEQHKEMLRRLKDGEFDAIIESRKAGTSPPVAVREPAAKPSPPPEPKATAPTPAATKTGEARAPEPAKPPVAAAAEQKDRAVETSLDDIILSYLVGEEDRDKK